MNLRAFTKEHCALCGEVSLFDSNGCRQHPGAFPARTVITHDPKRWLRTQPTVKAKEPAPSVANTRRAIALTRTKRGELSELELKALELLALDLKRAEMAERLGVARGQSVNQIVARIYSKLRVPHDPWTRDHAVLLATARVRGLVGTAA